MLLSHIDLCDYVHTHMWVACNQTYVWHDWYMTYIVSPTLIIRLHINLMLTPWVSFLVWVRFVSHMLITQLTQIRCHVGWLADWLAGYTWFAEFMTDMLAGWLTGWLIHMAQAFGSSMWLKHMAHQQWLKHMAQTCGSSMWPKHRLDQQINSRQWLKHWLKHVAQSCGSNMWLKHVAQTCGSNIGSNMWLTHVTQICGSNMFIDDDHTMNSNTMPCWLVGWLAGWLAGWFDELLTGLLVGWLAGWLAGLHMAHAFDSSLADMVRRLVGVLKTNMMLIEKPTSSKTNNYIHHNSIINNLSIHAI